MNKIRKIQNGNIEFLDNENLINTFLPDSEIIEGGRPYQITVSNTGNNKLYSFDFTAVTQLITPTETIPAPSNKKEFIKILLEKFFYSSGGTVETLAETAEEILNVLDENKELNQPTIFFYFQFPFTVDFGAVIPPTIIGNVDFFYFDGFVSVNLNNQVFTTLQALCNILNNAQNVFIFSPPKDLTQIENYVFGNTTLEVSTNTESPKAYIQNTLLLRTNQGLIDNILYEGYATPETVEQNIQLQLFKNNENLISLLSGANYSTQIPLLTTKAPNIGTAYMLTGIKATNNVVITIKSIETYAETQDNSFISLLLNPAIALPPVESLPYPNSLLTLLSVSEGVPNNTPQIVTGGVIISNFPVLGTNQGQTGRKEINRKICLKKGDLIIVAATPRSVNLEIIGFLSWLEM